MTAARRLPALAAGVELADFDTEIVALVAGERRAVHLEGGQAIVLDSCRRGDDVDTVVAELAAASGDERAAVEAWLGDLLVELARVGVVVPVGPIDSDEGAGRGEPA